LRVRKTESLSALVESHNAHGLGRWAPNFGRAGRPACDHAGRPPSYAGGPHSGPSPPRRGCRGAEARTKALHADTGIHLRLRPIEGQLRGSGEKDFDLPAPRAARTNELTVTFCVELAA
jgi:hypothetical protein